MLCGVAATCSLRDYGPAAWSDVGLGPASSAGHRRGSGASEADDGLGSTLERRTPLGVPHEVGTMPSGRDRWG